MTQLRNRGTQLRRASPLRRSRASGDPLQIFSMVRARRQLPCTYGGGARRLRLRSVTAPVRFMMPPLLPCQSVKATCGPATVRWSLMGDAAARLRWHRDTIPATTGTVQWAQAIAINDRPSATFTCKLRFGSEALRLVEQRQIGWGPGDRPEYRADVV
jgi:hypothetical protein